MQVSVTIRVAGIEDVLTVRAEARMDMKHLRVERATVREDDARPVKLPVLELPEQPLGVAVRAV